MAKLVCKILGVLFFVIGIVGLVIGEDAHRYHALVRLAQDSLPSIWVSPVRCQVGGAFAWRWVFSTFWDLELLAW